VFVVADHTYLFLAHVPAAGVDDYREFIARVLPLVEESGGRLDRRLASDDETIEIFIVSFVSSAALEQLQASTHLDEAALRLYRSGARFEVMPVTHDPIATAS
jgi:hypothetical protein